MYVYEEISKDYKSKEFNAVASVISVHNKFLSFIFTARRLWPSNIVGLQLLPFTLSHPTLLTLLISSCICHLLFVSLLLFFGPIVSGKHFLYTGLKKRAALTVSESILTPLCDSFLCLKPLEILIGELKSQPILPVTAEKINSFSYFSPQSNIHSW